MIPLQGTAAGTGSLRQAALLIDADNFFDPQALHAAWAELEAYAGRVSVCRAYGHGPRLQSLWSVWRYLGARTFPNLALEKNTTDAALIADAVALHFQQGVQIFVIASGDADFAPLAVRLREWGCEVWCFSMEGIVFRDAQAYYDRVKCFPAPVFTPAPVTPAPLRPVMPSAGGDNADAARPAYRAATEPLSTTPLPDAGLPDEVERILKAVPGLREGPQHLCNVVPVLQQHNFFDKKTTKSTAFLARHAAYFELSPAHKPTQIVFRPPSSALASAAAICLTPLVAGADALATVAPADSPEDAQALQRIFATFPAWLPGTVRQLSMMNTLLQEGGVQLGSKPLDELFGGYPDFFKLLPDTGPALKVRLLKKPQGLASAC